MTNGRQATSTASRVVVSNVFGDNNRGGAAITKATIDFARTIVPGAEVALVAVSPKSSMTTFPLTASELEDDDLVLPAAFDTRGTLGGLRAVAGSLVHLALGPRTRNATLATVSDATLTISKGGFVFVDRIGVRGLLSFWLTVFPIIFAIRCRVPTVAYGATVGPFVNRWAAWLNGFVLRRVSVVMPRDPYSRAESTRLGIPASRLVEMPDSVFSMWPAETSSLPADAEALISGKRYLPVTARLRCKEDEGGLARLAKGISLLIEEQKFDTVVLVQQVTGVGTNDDVATERLATELGRLGVPAVRLPPDLDYRQLCRVYQGAQLSICCRMHGAIFSMIAGTHALALEMDGVKAAGVYSALGFPSHVLQFDSISPAQLARTATSIIQRDGDAAELGSALGAIRKRYEDAAADAATILAPRIARRTGETKIGSTG